MTETDWDLPPDGETPEEMERVRNQERAEEDHRQFLDNLLWNRLAGYFDRDGRPYCRIPLPTANRGSD